MLAGLISASIWFGMFIVGHIAAFRLASVQRRSKLIIRLFATAIAGHLACVAVLDVITTGGLAGLGSSLLLSAICGVLLLLCLLVLYMPFYYTLNTSLSVETLAILGRSTVDRLPTQEMERRFTSLAFLQDRLATMQANGYLEKENRDLWILTPRGRRIATVMNTVNRLLSLGPGG